MFWQDELIALVNVVEAVATSRQAELLSVNPGVAERGFYLGGHSQDPMLTLPRAH